MKNISFYNKFEIKSPIFAPDICLCVLRIHLFISGWKWWKQNNLSMYFCSLYSHDNQK